MFLFISIPIALFFEKIENKEGFVKTKNLNIYNCNIV